jgi:hypothetical protein
MKAPAESKPRLKLLGRDLQLAQIDAKTRKQAAVVLEVLAGLRTPQQAADALEVALPTYFHLEVKALRGLLWACTPSPPGRQHALGKKLRQAEARCADLERQLHRYQALMRNAQRGLGLSAPEPPKDAPQGKRRKRTAVRALRAIKLLNQAPTPSAEAPAEVPASSPLAPVASGA